MVLGAGSGRRMGTKVPKQHLGLGGEPILVKTIRTIQRWQGLRGIVLTARGVELESTRELLRDYGLTSVLRVVEGGNERQDSVRNALDALTEAQPGDVVMIHDCVRPFVPVDLLDELCLQAAPDGAILAVPCRDTVKRSAGDGAIEATLDRDSVWLAQTPQAFPYELILEAHRLAVERGIEVTDDASVVEALGHKPRIVPGRADNFKVTTPEEYKLARLMVEGEMSGQLRIGHGYDVHALKVGRKLILAGVDIPHELGLMGHSDADVICHAIADAVLGAAGMGDIGVHFPDTDPRYKGASSIELLKSVQEIVAVAGFKVVNVDATVVAQRPKVSPHRETMEANVAQALCVELLGVNIKATTTEGLGFEGEEKGISCHAVALLRMVE